VFLLCCWGGIYYTPHHNTNHNRYKKTVRRRITTTIEENHNMNGVEEWEAMTSAERAARIYHYAALASRTWAKEIDPRLIPFGIALREAFDTVRRQDAEKKKNAIKEDHNVGYEDSNDDLSYGFPRSKLGRDYILWRLTRIDEKLDLLTEIAIRLQSRLEIIADGSQFQCDFFPGEVDQDA